MDKVQTVVVGTHDGVFHADDVVAIAILRMVYRQQFGINVEVIRTRNPKVLSKECEICVDVGGGRFDHHQKGGNGARDNGIQYASAGLIWKFYGKELCQMKGVWELVDKTFIQIIDASDNGQKLFDGGQLMFKDVAPLSFSKVIVGFNPTWLEQEAGKTFDKRFEAAVDFAEVVLDRMLHSAEAEITAQKIVEGCIYEGNPIVVLEKFVPWQETLVNFSSALFVVFPSSTNGQWMVQAVPTFVGGFQPRRAFPQKWAGLNETQLDAVVGLKDCVFCHNKCFIGAHKTREGAIAMAQIALASQ